VKEPFYTSKRPPPPPPHPHTQKKISTGSRVMSWIFDEYSKFKGFSPAAVTGKPLQLHGSHARESATGRGVVVATRELLRAHGAGGLEGKSVVIQGFGNVGGWAARLFHEAGARVLAVSDRHGATFSADGLDVAALRRHTRAAPPFGGSLRSFPGGRALALERLLELPCDVLVPAAVPSVVNAETARTLGCRFLVEAANASTTPAGDRILRERGIAALPDIVSWTFLLLSFCSSFCFFLFIFAQRSLSFPLPRPHHPKNSMLAAGESPSRSSSGSKTSRTFGGRSRKWRNGSTRR